MDRKAVELTWDDILSQITKIKKKNKINSKTKIYGVPKNGMILAGFFGCKNVYNPKEADFILDDIVDSGRTKYKYKKLYPKIKFLSLYTKSDNLIIDDNITNYYMNHLNKYFNNGELWI